MGKNATIGIAIAFAATAAVSPSQGQLTQRQIEGLVQSSYDDVDTILLTVLSGGKVGGSTSYLYGSIPYYWLWQGRMTGETGGAAFQLNYQGVDKLLTDSAIWSLTGTLLGDRVTGGGTAIFAYPRPTSFSVTYDDTLMWNGSTATVSFTAHGFDSGPDFAMLGSTGRPEVSIGPVILNGVATANAFGLGFKDMDGVLIDNASYDRAPWLVSFGDYGPILINISESVPAPELSTWTMILAGFVGLGYATVFRKAQMGGARSTLSWRGAPERPPRFRKIRTSCARVGGDRRPTGNQWTL